MKITSNKRPSLKDFGVAAGAKELFRIVNIGPREWVCVSKKGTRGTMRQTVRQRSSKIMREGGYGRTTLAIKGHQVARIERTENKEFRDFAAKRKESDLRTSLHEALNEFFYGK